LPLPSSPHWAPTMTAVLPLLVLLALNANSIWEYCGPPAAPWFAHTGRAAAEETGKLGKSAVRGVYAPAYRIGLWRSNRGLQRSEGRLQR
jgi:hypothetical protein